MLGKGALLAGRLPGAGAAVLGPSAGTRLPTHPAVAALLVSVVKALFLGQGQLLPLLIEVTESGVHFAIIHTA